MANHFGAYFHIHHEDEREISRLENTIRNGENIEEVQRIQYKSICVLQEDIITYDPAVPNRISVKFEFRRYLPYALMGELSASGFTYVAEVYDLGGGRAWGFSPEHCDEVTNWLDEAMYGEETMSAEHEK